MHIYDFFRDIFSVFGDFSRFLGVKFGFRKSCLCKRNDKYKVCWGHFQNKTYWEVGVEKDNSDIEPSNIYNILLLSLLTHICRPVQRTDPLEEFLEVWSPNQSLIPPCPTQFSSSLIKLDLTPIFYKGCCLITAFTTGERTWTSKVLWMRKPAIKSESISQIAFDRSRRSVKEVFIRFFFILFLFSHFSVRAIRGRAHIT